MDYHNCRTIHSYCTGEKTPKYTHRTLKPKRGSVTYEYKPAAKSIAKHKPQIKKPVKQKNSTYRTAITQTRDFRGAIETTTQISRTNSKGINVEQFKNIYAKIRASSDDKLIVRAMNGARWWTFKGYSESDLNIDTFEDYYQNKVKETGKFENFGIVSYKLLH